MLACSTVTPPILLSLLFQLSAISYTLNAIYYPGSAPIRKRGRPRKSSGGSENKRRSYWLGGVFIDRGSSSLDNYHKEEHNEHRV